MYIGLNIYKKKRGQFTSSTFRRYWGKPILLKRVNAHARWRELSTSVLAICFPIPQLSNNKNLKADIHPICLCFYISLSP